MKTTLSILIVLFFSNILLAQTTSIPDPNFEQALINLGYDTGTLNGTVPTANIDTITNLNVGFRNISDLTGIENFISLSNLNCNLNSLTSLDFSQNTSLTVLTCFYNQLTNLNVTQNTSLIYLDCADNQLANLDITQNLGIVELRCYNNSINSLLLPLNGNLGYIDCHNNQLIDLSVSQCIGLTELDCSTNQLTGIDVSQNLNLEGLNCSNNQLSSLDVSFNNSLIGLDCSSNLINCLNVKNGNYINITIFNTSNNPSLTCIDVDNISYSTSNWTNIDGGTTFSSNCNNYCSSRTLIPDVNFEQALINLGYDVLPLDGSIKTSNIDTITYLDITNLSINDLTGIEDFTSLSTLICDSNSLPSLNISQNTLLETLDCSNNLLTSLYLKQHNFLNSLNCSSNLLNCLAVNNGNNINFTQFIASNNSSLSCITVDDELWANTNWLNIDVATTFSNNCNNSCFLRTIIPDANFEQALINLGYDNIIDGSVMTAAIDTITILNINNKNISNLTGLEDFIALQKLYCRNNQINSMVLPSNFNLLSLLDCGNNQLSSLGLSQYIGLNYLICDSNQLSYLNLSLNTNLKTLNCSFNTLTNFNLPFTSLEHLNCSYNNLGITLPSMSKMVSLNCSHNHFNNANFQTSPFLTTLDCSFNSFTSFGVPNGLLYLSCQNNILTNFSTCNSIISIDCSNNQLPSIYLRWCPNLTTLNCSSNLITTIDVTKNTMLTDIDCSNNLLTSLYFYDNLNLKKMNCSFNQLPGLDFGNNISLIELNVGSNELECLRIKNSNNSNITFFDATNNPSLFCIEVDDATWSNSNWLNIGLSASFSTVCSGSCDLGLTLIPDTNFEQTLINSNLDVAPINGNVHTVNIEAVSNLNISNKGITDLTGIQDFSALQILNCSYNSITSLDFSNNIALSSLYCHYNQLINLNLYQNTNLTNLYCNNNQLTSLNLSQNPYLTHVDCRYNQLVCLNVKNGNNIELAGGPFANSNPSLTCIEVDNVAYSSTSWAPQFIYSTNCNNSCSSLCDLSTNFTTSGNGNGNFSFTNISTGNFTQSHWAFGDGTTSTLTNPNHTFTSNGTYVVVLTVNNSTIGGACIDYYLDTIIVIGVPIPLQCVAGFVIYSEVGTINSTVINSSTGLSLSYLWDFGDGNTSTQQFPNHNYTTAGPFYLCLTVNDGIGCVDTYCDSIGIFGVIFNKQNGFTINVVAPPIITKSDNNLELNSLVRVCPNPTSTQLTIDTKIDITEVVVIDHTGKTIKSVVPKKNKIDVADLSNGIYFIKIVGNEQTVIQKFVKD